MHRWTLLGAAFVAFTNAAISEPRIGIYSGSPQLWHTSFEQGELPFVDKTQQAVIVIQDSSASYVTVTVSSDVDGEEWYVPLSVESSAEGEIHVARIEGAKNKLSLLPHRVYEAKAHIKRGTESLHRVIGKFRTGNLPESSFMMMQKSSAEAAVPVRFGKHHFFAQAPIHTIYTPPSTADAPMWETIPLGLVMAVLPWVCAVMAYNWLHNLKSSKQTTESYRFSRITQGAFCFMLIMVAAILVRYWTSWKLSELGWTLLYISPIMVILGMMARRDMLLHVPQTI